MKANPIRVIKAWSLDVALRVLENQPKVGLSVP